MPKLGRSTVGDIAGEKGDGEFGKCHFQIILMFYCILFIGNKSFINLYIFICT